MPARVTAVTVALLMAAVGWSTPSAVGASTDVIVTDKGGWLTRLGPWRNVRKNPTLAGAIRAFGSPTSKAIAGWECRFYWSRRRISATFGYPNYTEQLKCGRSGRLDWFITGSPNWHTDEGLKVGSPTSRIHALYPAAEFKQSGLWTLTRSRSQDTTTWAEPAGGKVKSLRAQCYCG